MQAIQVANVKRVTFNEKAFRTTLVLSAILILVILLAFFLTLMISSMPTIKSLGFSFITGSTWDPVGSNFGMLPFLLGTLITSFLALIIALPFSISVGISLGEFFKKGWVSAVFKNAVELLAGIPSVVYGFWGMFVLVPKIRTIELKLGITPYGVGIFTASLVLAIMILPYAVSLIRQVISMVPGHLKEAAYSLGATRYEVLRYVIIPYTRSGIFAGILLALGRALGETMAVTMLIGNTHDIPKSIFGPGDTMASVIANEFTEAVGDMHPSALIEMGMLLFIVTLVINLIGRKIINRFVI